MTRIFTAIDLPDGMKEEITSTYWAIKGIKWIKKDNLHLTLNFIGDVDSEELDEVIDNLSTITFKPFRLNTSEAGYFKSGAIWIGLEKCEKLNRLFLECKKRLEWSGVRVEKRGFKPHITVGRSKKGCPNDYIDSIINRSFGSFRVERFSLYSSILKPTGAEYNKITDFPIAHR